jgi:hypothetical protein
MIKKNSGENPFFCKICEYKTFNKYDWTKHLNTKKHIKIANKSQNNSGTKLLHGQSSQVDDNKYTCVTCGKGYKFSSGLSRHIKMCSNATINPTIEYETLAPLQPEKTIQTNVDIVTTQHEQIKNLQELLQKTIENQQNMIGKIGNTTTNNINNTMTINLILNEKCKNAMNLTDFMKSLKLSPDDLKYTCDNGYIKGITNIFVKHLADMNPNNRPFHCSDNKTSLDFFVKDQNTWEKDNKHKKINHSIEQITQRQIQHIKEWERCYPNWNDTEAGTEMYMNMIKESMGGMTDNEKSINIEYIKKEIGTKMEINNVLQVEDMPSDSETGDENKGLI